MADYTLPEKQQSEPMNDAPILAANPSEWLRRVTIPANKAVLSALEVGEDAEIVIRAKVTGKTDRTSSDEYENERSVQLEILSVNVPEYDDAQEEMDSFERGLNRKRPLGG